MILFFSVISPQGELRRHSISNLELELVFDLLNHLVAVDYRLVSASLLDQGHWTHLPLDAFDGTLVSAFIRELKDEYQRVLAV